MSSIADKRRRKKRHSSNEEQAEPIDQSKSSKKRRRHSTTTTNLEKETEHKKRRRKTSTTQGTLQEYDMASLEVEERSLPQRSGKQKVKRKKPVLDIVITILLFSVFLAMIVFYVKFDRAEVVSGSMEPTLMTNEKVVIINGKAPKRFNMIVFYPPNKTEDKYVKRVIGLPGDIIEYRDDILYVNSEQYDEPYLIENKEAYLANNPGSMYTKDLTLENIPGVTKGTTKIPADMYLVLGDNRQNSQDSRYIGLIPKSNLIGAVWKKDPLPTKIKKTN